MVTCKRYFKKDNILMVIDHWDIILNLSSRLVCGSVVKLPPPSDFMPLDFLLDYHKRTCYNWCKCSKLIFISILNYAVASLGKIRGRVALNPNYLNNIICPTIIYCGTGISFKLNSIHVIEVTFLFKINSFIFNY